MSRPAAQAWHTFSVEQTVASLQSTEQGLDAVTAQQRLIERGENRLAITPAVPVWRRLLAQFHNALIYVLLLSAVLSLASGKLTDALVILLVVVINGLMGWFQEHKAASALNSLQQLIAPMCLVHRDGYWLTRPATELVPGDLIRLASGDRIPADARLLSDEPISVQESALTGESTSVSKQITPAKPLAPLAEQHCLLFAGTMVTQGRARAMVIRTAEQTELGRIHALLRQTTSLETPLTRQLAHLGHQLSLLIMLVALLTFCGGWLWRSYPLGELAMAAVSLAVAAIPEGLPAVITVSLALGVQQLARRHAIIRHLPAVETLGAVSVICTDKTGTLTCNRMTVRWLESAQTRWIHPQDGQPLQLSADQPHTDDQPAPQSVNQALVPLLTVCVLCNEACFDDRNPAQRIVIGDPGEGALLTLAEDGGMNWAALRQQAPPAAQVPYESALGFMASRHPQASCPAWLMKGAPEKVLARCAMHQGEAEYWQSRISTLADAGLRLLALAWHDDQDAFPVSGWQWLGLVGLEDPPRPEVPAAVSECRAAGVHVLMITGDHPRTARAIAARIGMSTAPDVITGQELEALDDRQLANRALTLQAVARATPEHKLRLVGALQQQGRIVAMTGDGVNDAPALKRADIGIAMGLIGTDAARDAADMVLADDNFATLRDAIYAGRRIYANLQRCLLFLLPTNIAQALVLFAAIVLDWPLPVTPLQILWVNLICSITLAIPLALEPADPASMTSPPRDPLTPILGARHWRLIALAAAIIAALTLLLHRVSGDLLAHSPDLSSTLAMNGLVAAQMTYLLVCRQRHALSFTLRGIRKNPAILPAFALLIVLQCLLCYHPWLQTAFHTQPLSWHLWSLVVAQGLLAWFSLDLCKLALFHHQPS